MKKLIPVFIVLAALVVLADAQGLKVVTVLKGNDPVELIDGKEVRGEENLSVVRGRYRYLFANSANKARFEKSPEEYQIQLGGGCGRMGSLSGAGNPDRYYVFNRRIYIFASESCRNSFKAAPEKHLEAPDPAPVGTADQKRRGAQLIDLALKGMGGAAKVDGVKTYQARIKLAYKQDEKILEYFQTQTIAFSGRYRDEYDWGTSKNAEVLVPGKAISIDKNGSWVREEPVREALERQLYRNPLAILKARKSTGFTAFAAGPAKVGDSDVELLNVGFSGATSTLAIDTKSGRILQIAYRDRMGAFGNVVKAFSDFREAGGLILPFRVDQTFNGKPVESPVTTYESITLNGKIDDNLFAFKE